MIHVYRNFAHSYPVRKETLKFSHEQKKENQKEKETKPLEDVSEEAAQETVHAWLPLINQVRQDIKAKNGHSKRTVKRDSNHPSECPPTNFINPEKGFRQHAREQCP